MKYVLGFGFTPTEKRHYHTKNFSIIVLSNEPFHWIFIEDYWLNIGIEKSTCIFKHYILL